MFVALTMSAAILCLVTVSVECVAKVSNTLWASLFCSTLIMSEPAWVHPQDLKLEALFIWHYC